jgi:hypothetical protein
VAADCVGSLTARGVERRRFGMEHTTGANAMHNTERHVTIDLPGTMVASSGSIG